MTAATPNPDRRYDDVVKTVKSVLRDLDNLQPSGDHIQIAMAYVEWLENAERMLRNQFIGRDLIWPGLNTERARQIAEHRYATQRLFNSEKEYQQDRFQKLIADLDELRAQLAIEPTEEIAVLDTNYLLRGGALADRNWREQFRTAPTVHLIIPHVVVDELDDLTHRRETKDLARAAIRRIDDLRADASHPCERSFVVEGATLQLLPDPPLHIRLPDNDAELMSRSQLVHAITGKAPTIVTMDRGMIVRAHVHGLHSWRIESWEHRTVPPAVASHDGADT